MLAKSLIRTTILLLANNLFGDADDISDEEEKKGEDRSPKPEVGV